MVSMVESYSSSIKNRTEKLPKYFFHVNSWSSCILERQLDCLTLLSMDFEKSILLFQFSEAKNDIEWKEHRTTRQKV